MFGLTIIKTADLPFYREIAALIKRHPEYLEGIRDGVVHLAFDPKRKPKPRVMTKEEIEYAKGMAAAPRNAFIGSPMVAAAYRDEQDALERNDTGL